MKFYDHDCVPDFSMLCDWTLIKLTPHVLTATYQFLHIIVKFWMSKIKAIGSCICINFHADWEYAAFHKHVLSCFRWCAHPNRNCRTRCLYLMKVVVQKSSLTASVWRRTDCYAYDTSGWMNMAASGHLLWTPRNLWCYRHTKMVFWHDLLII